MKILCAIQGTGNGHLARATEIVPLLRDLGETDVLVSGRSGDLELPFSVKYRFYGISFAFGEKGGVDLWKTLFKFRWHLFLKNIIQLPVKNYDLVISDFEPVSAWACKLRGKKCIGLSHQNAVLHPDASKPNKKSWVGKFILKHYAPSNPRYGFHFKQLDRQNFTPVIRSAIRQSAFTTKNHYTVYLPAYSNSQIEIVLSQFPDVKWEVFSKHSKSSYTSGNISFQPVSAEGFNHSFIGCKGILCTAGFETPAEAIFMGKKLCVVPIKNQYEQLCNAAFLEHMGIKVLPGLLQSKNDLQHWLNQNNALQIAYPDITREVLAHIMDKHFRADL